MREIINKAINMIIKKDVTEVPSVKKIDSVYEGMTLEELKAVKKTFKLKLYTSKGDARKDAHSKIVELDSLIAFKEKAATIVDNSNDKKLKNKKSSK